MKPFITAIALTILATSCDVSHQPYLKHKVEMVKIGKGCAGKSEQFSMNSNTNGERYIFQECLDADSDKNDVVIERKGDTVSIRFNRTGEGQQLYNLTVDINTQPRYNWLVVGSHTIAILPAAN